LKPLGALRNREQSKERAGYLQAIANEIDARWEEMARISATESGLIHRMARESASNLGKVFRYYAGFADTFPFQERHTPSSGIGVGLLVLPFRSDFGCLPVR
jgi:aldehyde dehydrogenase (NAD+)